MGDIPNEVISHHENAQNILHYPCETCLADRAFKAINLLKDYLWTRTYDERLTGLALMYIHPEIDIDIQEVIDVFASKHKRRLDLVL